MNIKKGDKVKIIDIKSRKYGTIGIVSTMATNGVIIQLDNGWYTAVKFEHLEKVDG